MSAAPDESFRAPPGAMELLHGRLFEQAMQELLGEEAEQQCVLIAHQSPCAHGRVPNSQPYAGCEGCGEMVLLTPKSLALTRNPEVEVRVVCVECAWAATKAVIWRRDLASC